MKHHETIESNLKQLWYNLLLRPWRGGLGCGNVGGGSEHLSGVTSEVFFLLFVLLPIPVGPLLVARALLLVYNKKLLASLFTKGSLVRTTLSLLCEAKGLA